MLAVLALLAGYVPDPPTISRPEPPTVCQSLTPTQASRHVIVSGTGRWPMYRVVTPTVSFEVGIHESQVRYVQTADKRFRTPEKLALGSRLADVRHFVQDGLSYDPNWAYYVTLPSGWSVAFAPSPKAPGGRAKIAWFFQRGSCSN
jgi:hypothetical protein